MTLTLSFQEHSFVEDLVISLPWWETSLLPWPSLICLTPMGSPGLDRSKFSWQAKTTHFEAVHYLFKGRGREFNNVTFVFLCSSGRSAQLKSKFCNLRQEEIVNPWRASPSVMPLATATYTLLLFNRQENPIGWWHSDFRHLSRENASLALAD